MIADTITVKVRFVSIMQQYSGNKREVTMEVPSIANQAIETVLNHFKIPWKDKLEKSTRIFINQNLYSPSSDTITLLKPEDTIAFIPISGGG
ncbi:MAG: MoaD/ThiS family protein [Deltaproteobacteria bacterium]|nr:MoaD/ThiS family protein [Deltaproteobacteria bacterium]MBW2154075.1 MoaD/ThiS family protein [Deltaproteobacteria bacterium]